METFPSGRGGPVRPDRVDRVLREAYELAADRGHRLAQALDLAGRMQPGIDAEPYAVGLAGLDPLGRRHGNEIARLEGPRVHLLGELSRIAPVDEDDRPLFQDQRDAGRSREAGQPGQAFGACRHIFAQELVGTRHQHAVHSEGAERRAQLGHPRLSLVRRGLRLECLEHDAWHPPLT